MGLTVLPDDGLDLETAAGTVVSAVFLAAGRIRIFSGSCPRLLQYPVIIDHLSQ